MLRAQMTGVLYGNLRSEIVGSAGIPVVMN